MMERTSVVVLLALFLLSAVQNLVQSNDSLLRRTFDSGNWNYDEILSFHFHTYFFQNNIESISEALKFRDALQYGINGYFPGCRLSHIFMGLKGPHVLGNFETCCNMTSFTPALSFFMLNHGNLSVLIHPLTRYEIKDHTTRSIFLGARIPIDISALSEDLGELVDLCSVSKSSIN